MSGAPSGRIGAVVIGRNEGDRLRRCLDSLAGRAAALVYVDSGSGDGSVALARSAGAEVVELDRAAPFTAARSRNAGAQRLLERWPDVELLQFVDGDCEVAAGWLEAAVRAIDGHADAAAVCGRRRERSPDASIYNRLCDMEWNTPLGPAEACGGDALMRARAFQQAGGFNPALIAGEEPELCARLRRRGWRILRIEAEMTLHDAGITAFGQWWKRTVRSGHAYAEVLALHGAFAAPGAGRAVRSVLCWTVALPLASLAAAWWSWGGSLVILPLGYGWLAHRIAARRRRGGDARAQASLYARYCVLGKFAELAGMIRYWANRARGRRTGLIEYRTAPTASLAQPATGTGGP
jgi:GT2 family glycosyltransferase